MKVFALALLSYLSVSNAFMAKSAFTPSSFKLSNVAGSSSTTLKMLADNPQVVLITGASRGLGAAMARDIGFKGHKIVINYYNQDFLEEAEVLAAEIKAGGGDAVCFEGDTSKPESIATLFKNANDHYGRIDCIINNAGITKDGLVLRMTPDQWQAVIDVNLSGVFYCSKEYFKYASKQRIGRIINIASVVGQFGNPGQANYAAAKGGVIGLTYANAKEFAARNVCVNAICPGFIESAMTAKLTDEYLKEMASAIPLKRLGKPEEVAGMATFLALDPAAAYITGHTFNVDGGLAIGC